MLRWVLWLLLAANVLTLLAFACDKLQARRGGRRVRESTLLWLLFLGGCAGAWLAMTWFRHKTSKGSFRWRAIGLTICNPLWAAAWWAIRDLAGAAA